MFGYIRPDIPYMYVKDGILYKAMYCGLCKSIGGSCGQCARMGLSYDMTFLSAILHNIAGCDVKIEKRHCVLHPVVTRPIASDDDITRAVACLNTLLTYYKLTDDVQDEGKGRFTRTFFKSGYKRAKARFPQMEEIVKGRMAELSALEKAGCDSLDRAADPFGSMIAELSDLLLGEYKSEDTHNLFPAGASRRDETGPVRLRAKGSQAGKNQIKIGDRQRKRYEQTILRSVGRFRDRYGRGDHRRF